MRFYWAALKVILISVLTLIWVGFDMALILITWGHPPAWTGRISDRVEAWLDDADLGVQRTFRQ